MTRPVMHLVDPKTGESDPADIRRVFDSQLATSLAWRESTIAERITRLKKLREAMLARRADFYAAFEKDYRKPAIEVDGTHPHDLHEPATLCLVEAREALVATLATLADGDPGAVQEAITMVVDLPPLAACSDRAALERMPTPPADLELRARVDAVRRDVQRAHELRLAGRYGTMKGYVKVFSPAAFAASAA